MNIAIIIQRYGLEINGGAELHARWIAEKLALTHSVTVLTTCARDYLYWHNHYPRGTTTVENIPVIRFKVKHPRRGRIFISVQNKVFGETHTEQDEIAWVKENGPFSPDLVHYLKKNHKQWDCLIFFSYRYYTSYAGLQINPAKSILVPTAEEDPVIRFAIYRKFFKLPAAIMYNSIEERDMIQAVSNNQQVKNVVVGVGINDLKGDSDRFRQKFGLTKPYLLYVGRIDKNKGCDKMIDYMLRFFERETELFDLVLLGGQYMNVPRHDRIVAPGFVSEQDKFDAIAGSEFMIIPSHLESLCMALLECWVAGKAALVNGTCKVLKGQVVRSNGGLYYHDYNEFQHTLKTLLNQQQLRNTLGLQGRAYFQKHYTWPVVMAKYEQILQSLNSR